jgi:hypothetical protein
MPCCNAFHTQGAELGAGTDTFDVCPDKPAAQQTHPTGDAPGGRVRTFVCVVGASVRHIKQHAARHPCAPLTHYVRNTSAQVCGCPREVALTSDTSPSARCGSARGTERHSRSNVTIRKRCGVVRREFDVCR